MGAQAYRVLCLHRPADGAVVEVGSERGEGSTAWLANWAARHRLPFRTADIDPDVYRTARQLVGDSARHCTGREMLARLRMPVSVAYLDGFDWIPPGMEGEGWIGEQRARYADLGVELTNEASEQAMLDEATIVEAKAAKGCVVVCDDTQVGWIGKGARAVPHLLDNGFELVDVGARSPTSLGYAVLKR